MRCRPAIVVLSVALVSQFAANLLQAKGAESIDDVRREELKAAEQWYSSALHVFNEGKVMEAESVYRASVGWKNASYESATDKPGRIAALVAHRDRMADLYKRAEAYLKLGTVSPDTECAARFSLLEARVWVLKESAKP